MILTSAQQKESTKSSKGPLVNTFADFRNLKHRSIIWCRGRMIPIDTKFRCSSWPDLTKNKSKPLPLSKGFCSIWLPMHVVFILSSLSISDCPYHLWTYTSLLSVISLVCQSHSNLLFVNHSTEAFCITKFGPQQDYKDFGFKP